MTAKCIFPYKKYEASLEKSVSAGRLELYESLANTGRLEDGLMLHCWNTNLSQALYWPLQAFEITLRNAMADRIADKYGDDWYDHLPTLSSSGRTSESTEVKRIAKAKEKLDKEGVSYGHDAIVAASSFGFWAGLLKEEYKAKLWDPLFSDFWAMIQLKEAFEKTQYIKDLRNNVAHYEPIIVFRGKRNKRELFKDYKLIVKLIKWICPETAEWIEHHSADKFFVAWNSCPDFFEVARLKVSEGGSANDSKYWNWK